MSATSTQAMTIRDQLNRAEELLKACGIETARLDAEVLLMAVMNATREDLIRDPDRNLSTKELKQFENWIARRQSKEPVAYLTGEREFWSMPFKVTPDVLIPRPDTEVLIETFLKYCPDTQASPRILDVGTGSGAIAITVAKERPHAHILASDISDVALTIAKENAKKLGVPERIDFIQAEGLDDKLRVEPGFDFILSNPPYVASQSPDLSIEVKQFEPGLAWDGGKDGLDFFRKFIPELKNFLLPEGHCFMEIGHDQAQDSRELSEQTSGLVFIEVIPDYAGRDRVVILKRTAHG